MLSLLLSLSLRVSRSFTESNDSSFGLCFLKIEVFARSMCCIKLWYVRVAPCPSDRRRSSLIGSAEHCYTKLSIAVSTWSFFVAAEAFGEPGGVVFCRLTPLSPAREKEYLADYWTDGEVIGWRNTVMSCVFASVGAKSIAPSPSSFSSSPFPRLQAEDKIVDTDVTFLKCV